MKVLCVTSEPILLFTERPRWHRTLTGGEMRIVTDCGVIQIEWEPDFYADGRSGGWGVDWLMPNVGNQHERQCWLLHDILFYDFGISFESTNSLFRQMLTKIGYSKRRVWLLYRGVSSFIARRKFGNNTPDELVNKEKVSVEWLDK